MLDCITIKVVGRLTSAAQCLAQKQKLSITSTTEVGGDKRPKGWHCSEHNHRYMAVLLTCCTALATQGQLRDVVQRGKPFLLALAVRQPKEHHLSQDYKAEREA